MYKRELPALLVLHAITLQGENMTGPVPKAPAAM